MKVTFTLLFSLVRMVAPGGTVMGAETVVQPDAGFAFTCTVPLISDSDAKRCGKRFVAVRVRSSVGVGEAMPGVGEMSANVV